MHIVLLHQYHHNPDCPAMCRHYDLTARWARRHRVTIVASDAWESKRLTHDYPWTPDGVDLVTVHVPYDNSMSTPRRLMAFASYARKAYSAAVSLPDADIIVGTSTPLSAAWAAGRAARHLNVPFVFEVRDLWPDFPIEMGAIRSRRLQTWLRNAERRLYREAAHVVALSPDMSKHVRSAGVEETRVTTVLQGTDVARARAARGMAQDRIRREYGFGDARVILYAGAFGRANDIPTMLAAARRLKDHTDLLFVFAGQGYYEDRISEVAARLPTVRLIPPQPRHRIFDWFALADLALVPFVNVPSVAASAPSKLFDALATGCPVLVTSPGWSKALVEREQCGWYCPAEDPEVMGNAIASIFRQPEALRRAGLSAASYAHRHFDRSRLADEFENILAGAANQYPD